MKASRAPQPQMPETSAEERFGGLVEAMAPRISIEAFCATPGFANAIQAAAKDRRMARTKVAIGMGSIAKAAKRYSDSLTPNLVIVESAEGGYAIFSELEQLAAVCDAQTKVIVAGPSNDVTIYRELLRQGVAEYIVTPSSPMQIIDAITSIYSDPNSVPTARLIAVIGVKGGVGASILSHNLAACIADQTKKDTILVDLDMEFGTAALDLNIDAKRGVLDALSDVEDLDDVKLKRLLYDCNPNLKLLAAPAAFHDDLRVDGEAMMTMLDVVRASADYVVIDVPHNWSPSTRAAISQADEVILVATPDLASLRNLKTLYERLQADRQNDRPPRIVLNQTGMQKRPEIPEKDFADIIGAPVTANLAFDGALFGTATNNGQLLRDVNKGHKIVSDIDNMAAILSGLHGRIGFGGAKKTKGLSVLKSLLTRKPSKG